MDLKFKRDVQVGNTSTCGGSSILNYREASLVVQWLRLCTSTAGGAGLISGQRTKIPRAAQCDQK